MNEPMFMNGAEFDRAAVLRDDDAWLAEALRDDRTQFLPVWRNRSLITAGEPMRASMLKGRHAFDLHELATHTVLLTVQDGIATFAVDVSDHDDEVLKPWTRDDAFLDLREAGPMVDARDGTLMALARGMMYWHRYSRFCSNCGAPTESQRGGFMRKCLNDDCGRSHFPRTDAAVIMLITRPGPGGGDCLLGRQAIWPEGRFSTLAGFVEPGETLEDAVAREVHEETGILVTDVYYQKSQPWPFPASLMLGFRGRATSHDISLNDNELQEARWFPREQVADFESHGFHLPRMGSISRWLISSWLAEEPELS
jgi:NAD+ diphosphatase